MYSQETMGYGQFVNFGRSLLELELGRDNSTRAFAYHFFFSFFFFFVVLLGVSLKGGSAAPICAALPALPSSISSALCANRRFCGSNSRSAAVE
jgi:hypothetical protein